MKRYWSQIEKLPIMVEESSESLGRLNAVFLDPDNGQIIAYLVGLLNVVVPVDLRQWEADKVVLSEREALVPPGEIQRLARAGFRKAFFNGKPVRSKSGYRYGRVRDFQLDLDRNELLNFEVSKRFFGFEWGKRIFEKKTIHQVTERVILVSHEPEDKATLPLDKALPAVQ